MPDKIVAATPSPQLKSSKELKQNSQDRFRKMNTMNQSKMPPKKKMSNEADSTIRGLLINAHD